MLFLLLTIAFAKVHHMEVPRALPNVMPWQAWLKVFRPEGYLSASEHNSRKLTYDANVAYIKKRNAENNTFTLGVNQFADMTQKEFAEKMLRPFKQTRKLNYQKLEMLNPEAEGIDWREQGAVTPVKNQGQCGSCWSFSTTGAVEGCVAIASGNLTALSEQELVNCDTVKDNGCGGGLMDYGFEWIAGNGGINSEDNWKYTAEDGYCDPTKKAYKVAVTNNHVDVQQDSDSQFVAALQRGPVSVAIEADQQAFQFYSGGIFKDACGTQLDHGVLAVGYAADYYIVKNSWGSTWGAQGYINLARTGISQQGGQCGILMNPSFPTECKSLNPGPKPTPGPGPSPGSEPYADPSKGCMSGETALDFPNVAGETCSKMCDNGESCPESPSHINGFSSCGIYQQETGHLRCAVFCSPNVPTSCDPENKMTCKVYDGYTGVCTYDD